MKKLLFLSIIVPLFLISCKKKDNITPMPIEANPIAQAINPIAQAIKLESIPVSKAQLDRIPEEYRKPVEKGGTIEAITYKSKRYYGDGSENEKKANVYLPAGYDPKDKSKKYKVLYLMHGIGGDENEWGMKKTNGE